MNKRTGTIAAFAFTAPLLGCGGAGGGSGSWNLGSYDGTVFQGGNTSTVVELTVAGNGSITGKCTMLSGFSGAIIGRANLSGTVGSSGDFALTGFYSVFIPPPPNVQIGGQVDVSGTVPAKGTASGPLHVLNQGNTFHGVISYLGP